MKKSCFLLVCTLFFPFFGQAFDYNAAHNQLLKLKADIAFIQELAQKLKSSNSISARRTASSCRHWNTAFIFTALLNDLTHEAEGLDYCKMASIIQLGLESLAEFINDIQNGERTWLNLGEQSLSFYDTDPNFSTGARNYVWDAEAHRIRSANDLNHMRWHELVGMHIAAYETLNQQGKGVLKSMLTQLISLHQQIAQIYNIPVVFYPPQLFATLIHGLTDGRLQELNESLQELLTALQQSNNGVAQEKARLHFSQIAAVIYQAAYIKTGEHIISVGNQSVDAAQILTLFLKTSPQKWVTLIQNAQEQGNLIAISAFNLLCFDSMGIGQLLSPKSMLASYFASSLKDWENTNQTQYVLASRLGLALVFEYLANHLELE